MKNHITSRARTRVEKSIGKSEDGTRILYEYIQISGKGTRPASTVTGPPRFRGCGVGVGVRALRMGGCACFACLRPSARVSRPRARFFAMPRPVIRRSPCAARRIGGCASAAVVLQFGVSMATAGRWAQRPHNTNEDTNMSNANNNAVRTIQLNDAQADLAYEAVSHWAECIRDTIGDMDEDEREAAMEEHELAIAVLALLRPLGKNNA